jgi:oxygen-independent coproporphyrinogen-3 oxidase
MPHDHPPPAGHPAPPPPPPRPAGPFSTWAPAALAATSPDAPLALYLHTPYCAHRCLFCPFYINPARANFSAGYTDILSRDIDLTATHLVPALGDRKVTAVFFGGGTPSDLDRDDLARILYQLAIQYPITPETEVTVEGRIRAFTADKAAAWVAAGANRFSVGLQTSDTTLRRRMGRLADRAEIRATLDGLCASGAVVIVDLIYGFPTQTVEMLLEDIRFITEETKIAGLDLYELREFPGSPLSRAIAAGTLPPTADPALRAEMLASANAALAANGFELFHSRHWRRDPRERSLYNRLARGGTAPATIIPFGSGAGGNIGGHPIFLNRDILRYADQILRSEKPIA